MDETVIDLISVAEVVAELGEEQCSFNHHCYFCGCSIAQGHGHAPDCKLIALKRSVNRSRELSPQSSDSATDEIMSYFKYDHLPQPLQNISRPFGELAKRIVLAAKPSNERLFALRQLLLSKDAAVRASLKT